MEGPVRPTCPFLLIAALLGLTGCGNVVRERPAFFRTNALLAAEFQDVPDDGLGDYAEPDGPGDVVARYGIDRLLDLADLLGLSMMGGYGLGANARATKAVQVGAGWYEAGRMGFIGRHAGLWWERRWEGGVSLAYAHHYSVGEGIGPIARHPDYEKWRARGERDDSGLGVVDFIGQNDRDFLDVGATAFVLGVGVDVEIRTLELADFILGLVTIDFQSDDTIPRERARMVDLAVYFVSERPIELRRYLEDVEDSEREEFLNHASDSVKVEALRSLQSVEGRRPKYARTWYAKFLDVPRSDLQEIAVRGLGRLTGKDFGYDPDKRREDNLRAIEAWKAWLRDNP